MIVVTGAAGFISSCLIGELNKQGFKDIVMVDDFNCPKKTANLQDKIYTHKIERSDFIKWLDEHGKMVQFVIHLGARTDTTEFNKEIFDELNVNYTKEIWNLCIKHGLPLIYASSGATYGMGEQGYSDSHEIIPKLKPLNPYGDSKNNFDKWAIEQKEQPYFWAGLKFFNVYGPNEYHKGRMASVVFHSFNQIQEKGEVKLFRSHNKNYSDGGQLRDFVYVKDVASVILFLMNHRKDSGLYNLGTGQARSFLDLAKSTFKALDIPENISFIDTPIDIRDKYQYYTQAEMDKLKNIGYKKPFFTLEEGVTDYVSNYLVPKKYM